MTTTDPIQFVRRRASEIFPGGRASGNVIASNIAFGVAVLGAGHVELNDDTDWWFIASDFDWLQPHPPIGNTETLFTQVIPFPEQGPTSHRPEIYVAAFAERAYALLPDSGVLQIAGPPLDEASPLPHEGVVPSWCTTVLGFRMPSEARPAGWESRRRARTSTL